MLDRKSKFTPYQIETAVAVLMESATVRNRVLGEMRFLEIDQYTEEGKKFMERESRKYAQTLLGVSDNLQFHM